MPARQKLWIAYALDGTFEQAGNELENLMRLFGHRDLLDHVEKALPSPRYQTAVTAYIESSQLTPYERARYLAALGRGREAVQALDEAEQQQSAWMVYLGIESAFDKIRTLPEFKELVTKAKIPDDGGGKIRTNEAKKRRAFRLGSPRSSV